MSATSMLILVSDWERSVKISCIEHIHHCLEQERLGGNTGMEAKAATIILQGHERVCWKSRFCL